VLVTYIICAVVGGVLVLLSLLFGHDHDMGGELHAEHDTDVHADLWIPFFTLRFWTYALTFFGLTGLSLTQWSGIPSHSIITWSIITGLVCGLGVSFAMFLLRRDEVTSTAGEEDIIGSTAKVLVAVEKEKPGKVRVELRGETIDMLAFTDEEMPLALGSRVLIVSLEGRGARVTSL